MISSDVIRGYNDTIVLSLLSEGDSYGYEISKQIRERTHERYVIKETTLYSTFNRLEKNGYIESYQGTETHGRRRIYYRITKQGLAYYQEKCSEWILIREIVNTFTKGAN